MILSVTKAIDFKLLKLAFSCNYSRFFNLKTKIPSQIYVIMELERYSSNYCCVHQAVPMDNKLYYGSVEAYLNSLH